MRKLFGTDGIRGKANTYPITAEIALRVGQALGARLRQQNISSGFVIVGRDTRESGEMLESAVCAGITSLGFDVHLAGIVPTPTVATLTRTTEAVAGIMLTASHNPYEDNGIKFFQSDGFKLDDEIELAMEELIINGIAESEYIAVPKIGKISNITNAIELYRQTVSKLIEGINFTGLRVAIDCANGAASKVAKEIFCCAGIGAQFYYDNPDGRNINANCGATHPEVVGKIVRESDANLGISFDGDADRVMFTDANGQLIDGDRILAICALAMKKNGSLKNDTLVVTSMSNLGLHDAMRKAGIKVEITDVGDRYVIERMKQGEFNLGGEKSGHIILLNHATTGDGILTAMAVLRILHESKTTLSELADCMLEYPQKLISMPVREKIPFSDLPGLTAKINQCEGELGDSGRVILRYSGTEKKVRVLVEARQIEAVEYWCHEICEQIKKDLCA